MSDEMPESTVGTASLSKVVVTVGMLQEALGYSNPSSIYSQVRKGHLPAWELIKGGRIYHPLWHRDVIIPHLEKHEMREVAERLRSLLEGQVGNQQPALNPVSRIYESDFRRWRESRERSVKQRNRTRGASRRK